MKNTFNKTDILRVLRERENSLDQWKSEAEGKVERRSAVGEAQRKRVAETWYAILRGALRDGLEVDGQRVKNPRQMAKTMANEICGVTRYGECGSQSNHWDASKAQSVKAVLDDRIAKLDWIQSRYKKALAELRKLREDVSLAGVPADIVARLDKITKMTT